ncbi:MAG TPA: N-acetyl-alpha-D-glucosaminyl L-malate synthase BshA [Chloroflexia bacterium]|nr:N-acetyl-alpha-D-glucosaminyl L-malate synthase BshA [Chloroflexia bacterium]
MRIGILCHSSCGGSSRVALELALHLARRDHQVHLFSLYPLFGLTESHERLTTHFTLAQLPPDLHPSTLYTDWKDGEKEQFIAGLIEVICQENLDILHFHYALPFAFLTVELKRRLGKNCPFLVGTLHGTDVSEFGRKPSLAIRLRWALSQMNQVTTVSANHAQLAQELLQLESLPRVVPNFIDLELYNSCPNQPKRFSRPARVIHISNFRPVKEPLALGATFAGICSQLDAELWLVGEGPGLEDLKQLFNRLGLNQKVRYWGLQPKVKNILSQADLLLMTSRAESFGLTILEAMACGIPVVTTRVGGVPELVEHGETGFLFANGEHDQAVNFALQLLTDEKLRAQFARAAKHKALLFNADRVVKLYEEIYNLALVKGKKTRFGIPTMP